MQIVATYLLLSLFFYCFELMFGLKVDCEKSMLIGVGISDTLTMGFAKQLGCSPSKLPTKYLGVSLHDCNPEPVDWAT